MGKLSKQNIKVYRFTIALTHDIKKVNNIIFPKNTHAIARLRGK